MTAEELPMTRRGALTGLVALAGGLVLAGCGADSVAPVMTTLGLGGLSLGPRFADGFIAPTVLVAETEQRAPYVLLGGDGWPLMDDAPDGVDLVVYRSETGEAVFSGRVDRHGERGVTPYYPLVFTPPGVGDYDVDGPGLVAGHRLRVVEAGSTSLIQVGEPMRGVDTPTVDDARGVHPICTRLAGMCPLHTITLAEAVEQPGPTALLVSTPRFCQHDVCGPALEVVIDRVAQLDDDWSVVHAEVYADPMAGGFTPTPAVTTYGLTFEPSLVVADRSGMVTGVVHFTMDGIEVAKALHSAS